MSDELLTLKQLQARLKCGRTRIYALLNSKAIPAMKIGKLTRLRLADVERFEKSLPPCKPQEGDDQ